MVKLKEYDIIELDNSGWFYQIESIDHFVVNDELVIDGATLVYDYEDCPDSDYSYVKTLDGLNKDRITAVYRKKDGKLELIYKKEGVK